MNEIVDNSEEEIVSRIDEEAVIQNEQFEIPMDIPIKEFGYHLKSHPRTILSAKFGDGKSYFLSKFEEAKKENYKIITLHPVNYQVVENKDIFELIKRDILFQITVKGMLDENLDISEKAAWAFYIQNNFMGLSENVISFLSLLQSPPEMVSGVLFALKTHKILKDLRKKVLDVKEKYKSTDALETFINKCDNISVLEEDLVTKIIQDSIDKYKKSHSNKRVVLVIEDMDRLDPAHLFRILNVFSAHLDTNEKYYVKSNGSYFYNKFHFDNVVFVMDFNNTKNIFKYFYGAETNFEGYIEKFVTKGIYKYSLEDEKYEYLMNKITSIVDLPYLYVREVLQPKYFVEKSLRTIVNSFENVEDHILLFPSYRKKRLHYGVLKLYAIMKNLGVDGKELIVCYKRLAEHAESIDVLQYMVGILQYGWNKYRLEYGSSSYVLCSGLTSNICCIEFTGYNSENGCLDYTIQDLKDSKEVKEYFASKHEIVELSQVTQRGLLSRALRNNDFENLPMLLEKFVE